MIARFRILLPFDFFIPKDEVISSFGFEENGFKIEVHPPMQTRIDTQALDLVSNNTLTNLADKLEPADNPEDTESILINEKPSIKLNLLQIDFKKDSFNRNKNQPQKDIDSFLSFVFTVLNNILMRMRTVIQANKTKPIEKGGSLWKIDYLDDRGRELDLDSMLFRKQSGGEFNFGAACLTDSLWQQVKELSYDYKPLTYDTLLLDAESSLPEVRPSIVLGFAALEALIGYALDVLAEKSSLSTFAWSWIIDRGGTWEKQPSVTEKYDVMLKIFTGKSLKDKPELWKNFVKLKHARDSFMHKGEMITERKSVIEISKSDAYGFIGQCKSIAEFVESLLPKESIRPKNKEKIKLSLRKKL